MADTAFGRRYSGPLEEFGEQFHRGLSALSAAEGLTDRLALRLLDEDGVDRPSVFLGMLRASDLVVRRNFEWRLDSDTRRYYLALLLDNRATWLRLNRLLLKLAVPARDARSDRATDEIPSYLLSGAGLPYHLVSVDLWGGLRAYKDLAYGSLHDAAWLGARLAASQQRLGVLPRHAPEVDFLKGIVLYREGSRIVEAVQSLRRVAAVDEDTREVAIALHLVGRYEALYEAPEKYDSALAALRRSIMIGNDIGDNEHVAQATHTLGFLMLKRGGTQRILSGLDLLENSLELLGATGDLFGRAQVLNTYAQTLAKRGHFYNPATAERMFLESLEIGQALGRKSHVANVLRNMATLLEADDYNQSLGLRAAADELDPRPQADRPVRPTDRRGRERERRLLRRDIDSPRPPEGQAEARLADPEESSE